MITLAEHFERHVCPFAADHGIISFHLPSRRIWSTKDRHSRAGEGATGKKKRKGKERMKQYFGFPSTSIMNVAFWQGEE
jgi:hypothetical protein